MHSRTTQGNYNRQANNTSYIKRYADTGSSDTNTWNTIGLSNGSIIPGSKDYQNLYIPGNLYIDGEILITSDARLINKNCQLMNCNKLMMLKPRIITYKNDSTNHEHYGFVAQELESVYPNLVSVKPHENLNNIKAINYIELIPLLVCKIQDMSKEIDLLKEKINSL